jgi:FlgD Ig-like domain
VTDRFGTPIPGKSGLAIQSPDNRAYGGEPYTGILRWPFVAGVAPTGWDAYRMDKTYYRSGSTWKTVANTFCCDLMDLGSGPTGPHYKHSNENVAANTGIFAPGDVIHYILAAKNLNNQWSYMYRTTNGQGSWVRTSDLAEAITSPCEWSVLPDRGRQPGDIGDMLYVDDADDRGGPAQLFFDWAFRFLNTENRVDRFDVLGPSSGAGNSLASRVKNVQTQLIGDPVEIYQLVLWDCADLTGSLMGDGGVAHGGSSLEKSDDFGMAFTFLDYHPDNPAWAYWGDNVVEDWSILTGAGAANLKSYYMNHALVADDQAAITGTISPKVWPVASSPWGGAGGETFYAFGGCPAINNFDAVSVQGTLAKVSHRYNNQVDAPAAVYQATTNAAASTAHFHLAGFGFNSLRDDDTVAPPDRVNYLADLLHWTVSVVPYPVGIEPMVFSNRLENAYPNPFNPTTTIKYSIASAGHVSLKIYNAAGQLVRTLVNEEQAPRAEGFAVSWDGTSDEGQSVASGVYFCKLTSKDFEQTKKMVLLK